ncbi:DUF1488 family protein [Rubrivivax sp. A210]|uniref:DUF1488 family protein n=1 Tax=Rubrivivax sp. A210 TaxID=2772301 RepID=UPI001917FA2D|nr:DUF1488 family protein [Rubrivivax sp. A210]
MQGNTDAGQDARAPALGGGQAGAEAGQEAATPSDAAVLPPPAFDAVADAVRFRVQLPDGLSVGARISRLVLHYRFKGQADGSDAVAVFQANRHEIDAAVVRRVVAGSWDPVMLREHDLPAPPRA